MFLITLTLYLTLEWKLIAMKDRNRALYSRYEYNSSNEEGKSLVNNAIKIFDLKKKRNKDCIMLRQLHA